MPVVDEIADAVLERELLRTAVGDGNAVHGKGALQVGELEEFVTHHVCIGFTLDVDDDAHAFAV